MCPYTYSLQDEVFFHRFHSLQTVRARRNAAQIAKKAKKAKQGDDEGSSDSSSDEELGSDGLDEDEADAFMEGQEVVRVGKCCVRCSLEVYMPCVFLCA